MGIFTRIFLITIFMVMNYSPSVVGKEVVRSKRQIDCEEMPANFQCNLCSKCNSPCESECAKCSGCEIAKQYGIDRQGWGATPTVVVGWLGVLLPVKLTRMGASSVNVVESNKDKTLKINIKLGQHQ